MAFKVPNRISERISTVISTLDGKLNDGRVIVVEQKKRADRGIAREVWLTINLPEFSSQPIVWHEHLDPLVVNIHAGRLYVVGMPPTQREFELLGRPQPSYLAYIWENGTWRRIPFSEIPEAIFDANMFLEGLPLANEKLVTLAQKDPSLLNEYPRWLRRIDPKFIGPFY
ncbi:hypothetical protein [Collimonas arenae]|uniref:hypothetical protein n=1 Tax=Collimonas arenae TaxID=279058 RepID=UPI0007782939|nr:hypothetical protein [Collimonas arenae]